jgi:hypothetical protein
LALGVEKRLPDIWETGHFRIETFQNWTCKKLTFQKRAFQKWTAKNVMDFSDTDVSEMDFSEMENWGAGLYRNGRFRTRTF